jgi:hypothetical protein
MIKGQRRGEGASGEYAYLRGIIGRFRLPFRSRGEYYAKGVVPWVPIRGRVDSEQPQIGDFKGGLLTGFSNGCRFSALPIIDESPWNGPTIGRILSSDKDYPACDSYDDVGRGNRIPIYGDPMPAFWAHNTFLHGNLSQTVGPRPVAPTHHVSREVRICLRG